MRAKFSSGFALFAAAVISSSVAQEAAPLPGTQPLTTPGDLSAQMVDGIRKYLLRETDHSLEARAKFWKRDLSSPEAYEKSIAPNRERFRKMVGAVDARLPVPV